MNGPDHARDYDLQTRACIWHEDQPYNDCAPCEAEFEIWAEGLIEEAKLDSLNY